VRIPGEFISIASLTLLAIAFTWPLGNFSQLQLPAHHDALFSVWRLAWIAHQLTNDPVHLFDANIFWPERNTLAFSDAMLLLGAVGAPLIWAGVHPVAVHNLLLIASFVCVGYAAMLLARHVKVGLAGQFVGGVVFAFAPYRVAHLGHLELLWTAFLPLALLALYRALESPTLSRGIALGLMLALQGMCSVYYLVFLLIWLVPALLIAPWHLRITWDRRHVVAAAGALTMASLLLAPYVLAYSAARQDVGPRPGAEIERYSATPADYLNVPPANRVYDIHATEAPDERSLFVGMVALVLSGASLFWRRTRRTAVAFALLALLAADLSLGVNGASYHVLRTIAPPIDGFRAVARFAVFALLAIAVLVGLTVQHIGAGLGRRAARHAFVGVLLAAMLVEYWSAPVAVSHPPLEPSELHRWLADQPRTVVLELPTPTPDTLWRHETTFQYLSIYHWQPLVNGYSGYAPRSYVRMLEAVDDFPSETALDFLSSQRVGLILLHERFMSLEAFARAVAACSDAQWFTGVRMFDDPVVKRVAACRVKPQS
jgi:hypothetical protein